MSNDGTKYTGEWKDDYKKGIGVECFVNGNRYEGEYDKGEKEGKGVLYMVDGS